MICKLLTPWSFSHSSVPTFEDLDLVYMDLCSPRFSRILIYIISVLLTSWSFCHNSLPTFKGLDLVYMDLCSHRFPRVLVLCDMLYLTNNWKYKKNSLMLYNQSSIDLQHLVLNLVKGPQSLLFGSFFRWSKVSAIGL